MIRICKFTKQAKTRTPKHIRKHNKQTKWICLLQSSQFRLFGKDHCWVDIPNYKWRLLNGWHIIKGSIVEYNYHTKENMKGKTIKIEKVLF